MRIKPKSTTPPLIVRLLRNLSGAVGLLLVTIYLIIGLLGATGITPHPTLEQNRLDRLKPPSAVYPLGTDLFGRDLASRLMEGAANSLRVALFSVGISASLGTLIGTLSGYIGGVVDNILMRIMDVFFALPALLLALVIVSVLGAGVNTTVLAIAIVYTPIFARVARGPVLTVKAMGFHHGHTLLGNVQRPNDCLSHPAEHPRAAHRTGQFSAVVVVTDRGRTQLSRAWHTAAESIVGRDVE